jgi:hypothetical protein
MTRHYLDKHQEPWVVTDVMGLPDQVCRKQAESLPKIFYYDSISKTTVCFTYKNWSGREDLNLRPPEPHICGQTLCNTMFYKILSYISARAKAAKRIILNQ